MGTNLTGMDGDGDKYPSPCSPLFQAAGLAKRKLRSLNLVLVLVLFGVFSCKFVCLSCHGCVFVVC